MKDLIRRETALKALEEICFALWEIDIPHPTCPEYIEHHEQVQRVMAIAEKWGRELRDAPDVQPEWEELLVICDVCGHAIRVKRNKETAMEKEAGK